MLVRRLLLALRSNVKLKAKLRRCGIEPRRKFLSSLSVRLLFCLYIKLHKICQSKNPKSGRQLRCFEGWRIDLQKLRIKMQSTYSDYPADRGLQFPNNTVSSTSQALCSPAPATTEQHGSPGGDHPWLKMSALSGFQDSVNAPTLLLIVDESTNPHG